jgi:hypothetical protein
MRTVLSQTDISQYRIPGTRCVPYLVKLAVYPGCSFVCAREQQEGKFHDGWLVTGDIASIDTEVQTQLAAYASTYTASRIYIHTHTSASTSNVPSHWTGFLYAC